MCAMVPAFTVTTGVGEGLEAGSFDRDLVDAERNFFDRVVAAGIGGRGDGFKSVAELVTGTLAFAMAAPVGSVTVPEN